ncbi:MAG: cell division protein ZapA [Gammaproteobacteria bacterium]|nr:cell division protein ZapA [Gammaproteobacteria bacterium]
MSAKGVNISILGRDFSVACPDDEQDALLEAARYLDGNMKEIQKSGKIIGADRVAIMAALNITNDLLKLQKATDGQSQVQERLATLQERIDAALREASEA